MLFLTLSKRKKRKKVQLLPIRQETAVLPAADGGEGGKALFGFLRTGRYGHLFRLFAGLAVMNESF